MIVAMRNHAEPTVVWAERVSGELLEPLAERWQHTQRVVERGRLFAGILSPTELDVLVAAAYLHDVGYAPELARTGFHPLDGARFVGRFGHERLAGLVAHHSTSTTEAEERGLGAELAEFPEENSLVSRALAYCDLTTGPAGEPTEISARLADITRRLGEDDPAARAARREAARLSELVEEMEQLLAASAD
jgi:hypothetical protein